jgi:hypothetical protein
MGWGVSLHFTPACPFFQGLTYVAYLVKLGTGISGLLTPGF